MISGRIQQALALLMVAPTVVFSLGCGRDTTIYKDPVASEVVPISVDGRASLPLHFYDQSANQGFVDVALDGLTETSQAIRLQTEIGANTIGGFNGPGTGNRAILGIGGHSKKKLTAVGSFSFDAKQIAGIEKVSILLQLDLNCDGTGLKVIEAGGVALGAGDGVDGGYTRFSAAISDSKWHALGTPIIDPDDPSTILLTSDSALPQTLTALTTKYPQACLRNGFSNADSLTKGLPMAGVLLALGGDLTSTLELNTVFVNRITVGSDVYAELE